MSVASPRTFGQPSRWTEIGTTKVKVEQQGEYRIAASREAVWEALNNPDVLGACITGCQEVSKVDDEHFNVKVKAKVGPVSATFTAELALQDLNPPQSYVIEGNVKGGAAGFGKGNASVELEEDGDYTVLKYAVKATVGGKLAQVGSRLVDGAARKMADEFFAAFSEHLDPGSTTVAQEAADQTPDTASTDSANSEQEPAAYEASGSMFVWGVAFVVLALAFMLAI